MMQCTIPSIRALDIDNASQQRKECAVIQPFKNPIPCQAQ